MGAMVVNFQLRGTRMVILAEFTWNINTTNAAVETPTRQGIQIGDDEFCRMFSKGGRAHLGNAGKTAVRSKQVFTKDTELREASNLPLMYCVLRMWHGGFSSFVKDTAVQFLS